MVNGDGDGDAEHGRGLRVVEALASRWGAERGDRARVWFELDAREPGGRPPRPAAR